MPELPNTEPVNAHLNRDEQAQRPPLFITVSEVINLTQSTATTTSTMAESNRAISLPSTTLPLAASKGYCGGRGRYSTIRVHCPGASAAAGQLDPQRWPTGPGQQQPACH